MSAGHLPAYKAAWSLTRLRIGIDAHAVGSKVGGNESYISAVLEGLKEFPQHDYFIYVSDDDAAQRVRAIAQVGNIRVLHTHSPLQRLGWRLTKACRADRVDALHVQYVAPIASPPIIVMVHDLSYYHHPEWFSKTESIRLKFTVSWTARRAMCVLTGSEYCREDLAKTLHLPNDKIRVGYHRVRSVFSERPESEFDPVLHRLRIRRPYILSVGNLQPRKNLPRLIEAWQSLRVAHSDFTPQLVIVGRKAWMFDEILNRAVDDTRAGNVVLTDYVGETDLARLYSAAQMFVYPSLFEGFGLPPLEAMACGAPVVVSNTTSLPEVCGDAAIYVDPTDVNQIASQIFRLYRDSGLVRLYRDKGRQRVTKFRNGNLMRVTVAAYEEAVRKSNLGR